MGEEDMGKTSTTIIEEMAVHAIKGLILNNNSKLQSEIPVGDRGVSFDGGINVYKSSNFKKDTLLGFVPVQVKGKSVTKFSPIQATFPVNMHDLENYYNAGGIIFFLTEILESSTVVFAKILLPLDITPLLKICKSKMNPSRKTTPTVSINLTPIKKYSELEILCMHFLREKKRQPPSYIGKHTFHDQNFEKIMVTSLSLNSTGKTSDLFAHDMYAYGINHDVEHPISIVKLDTINRTGTTPILISEKEIQYNYSLFETQERMTLILENTLTITYDNQEGKVNFKIADFYSFNSYKKTLLFLKEIHHKKNISLFGGAVQFIDLIWKKENFIDFDNELKMIPLIEKVFNKTGISLDYITKSTTLINLAYQTERFLIEKNYDGLNLPLKETVGVLKLNIEEDFLLTYYSPKDQMYKSLNVEDFNDVGIVLTSEEIEQYYNVSPFLLINVEDSFSAANTNSELVKKSFHPNFHTYNELTFRETNRFCIDCINKYDQDREKEYLDLVLYIGQLVLEKNNTNINKAIMTVNFMQAKFRMNNSLDENDQQELVKIKEEKIFANENLLKFCCNVLLQNKSDSKYYFSLLSQEEKEDLKTFPINLLYEELCK